MFLYSHLLVLKEKKERKKKRSEKGGTRIKDESGRRRHSEDGGSRRRDEMGRRHSVDGESRRKDEDERRRHSEDGRERPSKSSLRESYPLDGSCVKASGALTLEKQKLKKKSSNKSSHGSEKAAISPKDNSNSEKEALQAFLEDDFIGSISPPFHCCNVQQFTFKAIFAMAQTSNEALTKIIELELSATKIFNFNDVCSISYYSFHYFR